MAGCPHLSLLLGLSLTNRRSVNLLWSDARPSLGLTCATTRLNASRYRHVRLPRSLVGRVTVRDGCYTTIPYCSECSSPSLDVSDNTFVGNVSTMLPLRPPGSLVHGHEERRGGTQGYVDTTDVLHVL